MSMFVTAEMVANSGHFTSCGLRGQTEQAGRHKPLIGFSQES